MPFFDWIRKIRKAHRQRIEEPARAREIAEEIDSGLMSGELKLRCPKCQGENVRFMSVYNVYQCRNRLCQFILDINNMR